MNQQPNLERPRGGEIGPWVLKENVTEEPGLKLGLEELSGKGGCSTWEMVGSQYDPPVPSPLSSSHSTSHPAPRWTHTHTHTSGQRSGWGHRVIRICNLSAIDQIILLVGEGQSCALF